MMFKSLRQIFGKATNMITKELTEERKQNLIKQVRNGQMNPDNMTIKEWEELGKPSVKR
jgi:hypothetical protein